MPSCCWAGQPIHACGLARIVGVVVWWEVLARICSRAIPAYLLKSEGPKLAPQPSIVDHHSVYCQVTGAAIVTKHDSCKLSPLLTGQPCILAPTVRCMAVLCSGSLFAQLLLGRPAHPCLWAGQNCWGSDVVGSFVSKMCVITQTSYDWSFGN